MEKHVEEVQLVSYSLDWPRQYEEERRRLAHILTPSPNEIEHIGSTAVPELAAKPIIDVALKIADISTIDQLVDALATLSYRKYGKYEDPPRYLFVKDAIAGNCAINLHIMDSRHRNWKQLIAFRDRLRQNPAIRDAYQKLKAELAEKHRLDRVQYTACKSEFVAGVLKLDTES